MMHAVIASKKNWLLLIINQILNQTPFPLPDTQNKTVSRKTVSVSRKIYRFPEISRRRTLSGDHVNMGQLGRPISPINGHRQIIGNPAKITLQKDARIRVLLAENCGQNPKVCPG